MTEKIIVIGGGEHATVVMEAILSRPDRWELLGFVCPDDSSDVGAPFGVSRICGDENLPAFLIDHPNVKLVLGIGDNSSRKRIVAELNMPENKWAVVVHSDASVSSISNISNGTVILRRAVLQPGVEVGAHCIINSGAILEHDCVMADFAHLAPGAVIGGGVTIGEMTLIGVGARIRDHMVIGDGVTVGVGAVVVSHVQNGEVVAGVPARVLNEDKIDDRSLYDHIDIRELCMPLDSTLRDAMLLLGEKAVALVVDEKRHLLGIVNNDDIRTAFLNNHDFDTPIANVMNRKYMYVRNGTPRSVALNMLKASGHRLMPILDENGKVLGLHLIDSMIRGRSLSNVAVIMAGGKGMRLRPITENIPKPMVKVAGRPILEHIILHLAGSGIREIYIAINYLGEVIEDYFKDGVGYGVNIEYLRETTPLGTGGALTLLENLPKEPLIVMNGDLITQFNIEQMLDYHDKGDYQLTIGVHDHQLEIPYGVIHWNDTENRVKSIAEKPTQHYLINGGVYIINPILLSLIEKNKMTPITDLIEKTMKENHRVGAHLLDGDWVDVGQHKDLAAARGL